MSIIRDCTKTLATLEGQFMYNFELKESPFLPLYEKIDASIITWNQSIEKQAAIVATFGAAAKY